jgi:hypothetical protein
MDISTAYVVICDGVRGWWQTEWWTDTYRWVGALPTLPRDLIRPGGWNSRVFFCFCFFLLREAGIATRTINPLDCFSKKKTLDWTTKQQS